MKNRLSWFFREYKSFIVVVFLLVLVEQIISIWFNMGDPDLLLVYCICIPLLLGITADRNEEKQRSE